MPCLRPLVEIRNTVITLTIKFPEIAIVFLDQVFSEFNDNSYNLNDNETQLTLFHLQADKGIVLIRIISYPAVTIAG